MNTVPEFTTPDELAVALGCSPRRVRQVARALRACRILGKRMILLKVDVEVVAAACEPTTFAEIKEDLFPQRPPLKASDQRGTIYFVRCVDWVKIGWSSDLKGRLKSLQTTAPGEIKLIGKTRGSIKQERDLHSRFAHHRVSGEWFNADPEILEFVEAIGR